MARVSISLLAGGLLCLTGCAMMPSALKKAEGHATEETATRKNYEADEKNAAHDPFASNNRKKDEEEEDAELLRSDAENPFEKSRKGSRRSKESDGLSKLLDGFSDPRKAEIYRDLGID